MKRKILGYAVSSVFLIILWYLISLFFKTFLLTNQGHFFPSPFEAIQALVSNWEHFLSHLFGTSYRLLISMGIALSFAIPLGLFIGYKQWAKRYLTPLVYTIYPIPQIVFWPAIFLVLGYLFGLEELARILFITLIIFFQLLVSIRDSAANLPRDYITIALVSGVRPFKMYTEVLLPGTLPEVFSSLRVSIGIGLFASYVAEATFRPADEQAFKGLGYYIDLAFGWNTRGMYAGILALAILGIILYLILELLEYRLCRWKRFQIDSED